MGHVVLFTVLKGRFFSYFISKCDVWHRFFFIGTYVILMILLIYINELL